MGRDVPHASFEDGASAFWVGEPLASFVGGGKGLAREASNVHVNTRSLFYGWPVPGIFTELDGIEIGIDERCAFRASITRFALNFFGTSR